MVLIRRAVRGAFTLAAALLTSTALGGEPSQEAQLHERLLTLDTHLDTPITLLRPSFDFSVRHDPIRDVSRVDLPRMRVGGLDAGFFAVFVPQGARDEAGLARGIAMADAAFSRIETLVGRWPEALSLVASASEVHEAVRSGKHAVLIGVENGHALGGKLERVAQLRARRALYITLVHTKNNELGDSSTDTNGPEHGGLSPFGRAVIGEMNRCGIMVDVSHASDAATRAAIDLSKTPVIASHSGARAVYDHPRNLTDELLRMIARSNGVVQVHAMSAYLRTLDEPAERTSALARLRASFPPLAAMDDAQRERYWAAMGEINVRHPQPLADITDVAAHIDYIARLVGIDHVGVGSDFDGGGGVNGLLDAADYPNLTRELTRLGYGPRDLEKIWGGNLLRVLRASESFAADVPVAQACIPRRRGVTALAGGDY